MSGRYVWCCGRCDGITSVVCQSRAEAACLASAHDQVWHGGAVTADVVTAGPVPLVVAT